MSSKYPLVPDEDLHISTYTIAASYWEQMYAKLKALWILYKSARHAELVRAICTDSTIKNYVSEWKECTELEDLFNFAMDALHYCRLDQHPRRLIERETKLVTVLYVLADVLSRVPRGRFRRSGILSDQGVANKMLSELGIDFHDATEWPHDWTPMPAMHPQDASEC